MLYLLEYVFIVDVNIFKTFVKQVSKHGNRSASFLKNKLRALRGLLYFNQSCFPSLGQYLQFRIKLCHSLPFSHRSDNDAAVLRFYALDELLESGSFFAAFDFG